MGGSTFQIYIEGWLMEFIGTGLDGNSNLRRATLLAKQNPGLNRGSTAMASSFQFQFKLQQGRRRTQTSRQL